ncbi:MAG: hypothetical protein M1828_000934 [Chrysothrix sp. TS-e1954]|nr:MAG: hypothetical protein M1828_000934 [Chrysothrix sp. TS-e1954]
MPGAVHTDSTFGSSCESEASFKDCDESPSASGVIPSVELVPAKRKIDETTADQGKEQSKRCKVDWDMNGIRRRITDEITQKANGEIKKAKESIEAAASRDIETYMSKVEDIRSSFKPRDNKGDTFLEYLIFGFEGSRRRDRYRTVLNDFQEAFKVILKESLEYPDPSQMPPIEEISALNDKVMTFARETKQMLDS